MANKAAKPKQPLKKNRVGGGPGNRRKVDVIVGGGPGNRRKSEVIVSNSATTKNTSSKWVRNVRPDTMDFRDRMYQTSLMEVPVSISLSEYQQFDVPRLNQEETQACTGFALATVANYLLRRRKVVPSTVDVSPSMFYRLARRYDEFAGEGDEGSSCRGAMKGWQKHGVCAANCWKHGDKYDYLTEERVKDALERPLGAYYRVNHKDIIAMHCALTEVGILYASANTHDGWTEAGSDGIINYSESYAGGHAFAIVAYDSRGFWIQNSWSESWGNKGFGLISYDDWLRNGMDVWVARLGAPVTFRQYESAAISYSEAASKSSSYSYSFLRPHIISIGNDGRFREGGEIGTSKTEVQAIFEKDFPSVTASWKKKRLLLYAHGGLVSEKAAVQRLADYRSILLEKEVYPISFIWHTDAWTTITNILNDTLSRRKTESIIDATKDFMLDRLDDTLEVLARNVSGKLQWNEMKENALRATNYESGAAKFAIGQVAALAGKYGEQLEIHVIGHSAGAIFLGPAVELLTRKKSAGGFGVKINTTTLWAPACTIDFFKKEYLPAVNNQSIGRLSVFNLTDEAEQDDNCARIYNKSLLYLVSNAFEGKEAKQKGRKYRTPLLGLEKSVRDDDELNRLFLVDKKADLVLSPNNNQPNSINHSTSKSHGDFDDNIPTVQSTLNRILGSKTTEAPFSFPSSASAMKDRRGFLNKDQS